MMSRAAKRIVVLSTVAAAGAAIAWQAAPALQNASSEDKAEKASAKAAEKSAPKPTPTPSPSTAKSSPAPSPQVTQQAKRPAQQPQSPTGKATPMEQRVATLGLLNKRNGLWRDLTMKPGESIRIGDVVIRLRACDSTAPWEPEQLTGSFVQVITRSPDNSWKRVFSGWLYKESPSLNVVEHPIYDVWTKACQMRHPDTGPDTIIARGGETAPSSARKSASRRSSADDSDDE